MIIIFNNNDNNNDNDMVEAGAPSNRPLQNILGTNG